MNSKGFVCFIVEKMGLEPTTFWLPAKRSSQLSYIPKTGQRYYNFIISYNF